MQPSVCSTGLPGNAALTWSITSVLALLVVLYQCRAVPHTNCAAAGSPRTARVNSMALSSRFWS